MRFMVLMSRKLRPPWLPMMFWYCWSAVRIVMPPFTLNALYEGSTMSLDTSVSKVQSTSKVVPLARSIMI